MSPLGQVTNPLASVIDGMLQGHQLGLQMRQQQMEEQAFQTSQALAQQKLQANDEQARNEFANNYRPVNAQGMVQVDPNDPRFQAELDRQPAGTPPGQAPYAAPGMPQPGVGVQEPAEPPEEAPLSLPSQQGQLNQQGLTPREAAMAAALSRGYGLVPADKSMLGKYKLSDGTVLTGERLSQQELAQRQLAAETAKLKADRSIPTAAQVPEIQKTMLENEQVPDPTDPTGKRTIPRRDLPKVREDAETHSYHQGELDNTKEGQKNQAQIAEDNRKAAEARQKAASDAADKRNDRNISSRIAIESMREKARTAATGADGKPLTPNAKGVQNRFDQREIDTDTKIMEAAQKAEQKAHAARSELGDASTVQDGEEFTDPITGKDVTMNPIRRASLKAQYDQQTALASQQAAIQKSIRAKHQWGEFAPGTAPAATSQAPAAAPAPAPPAVAPAVAPAASTPPARPAAAPKYKEGDIVANAKGDKMILKGNKWIPTK